MPSKVFDYIAREQARQDATVELIASENFVSENVLRAVGSCLTNKYAEGYPAERVSGNRGRYYVRRFRRPSALHRSIYKSLIYMFLFLSEQGPPAEDIAESQEGQVHITPI